MNKDNIKIENGFNGKVRVELRDSVSEEIIYEIDKDNMVFNQDSLLLLARFVTNANLLMFGIDVYSGVFPDPFSNLFSAVYLSGENSDTDMELESNYVDKFLAMATRVGGYSGTLAQRGTINMSESYFDGDNNKLRCVFDFATDKANVTFQSVGFFSTELNTVNGSRILPAIHYIPKMSLPRASRLSLYDAIGNPSVGTRGVQLSDGTVLVAPISGNAPSIIGHPTKNTITKYSSRLKTATGTLYNPYDITTFGTALYALLANTIYKYDNMLAVDGVNASSEIAIIGIGLARAIGIIDSTKAIVLDGSTSIDPATGEAYNMHLKLINLTTGGVISKIRRGGDLSNLFTLQHPSNIINATAISKILVRGNKVEVYIVDSYESIEIYDLIDEELSTVYTRPRQWNVGSPNFRVAITTSEDICILYFSNSNNTVSYNTFIASEECGFYALSTKMSKFSRVLLPAPVTKLNTQTMKITYDIVFPEGCL